MTADGRHAGPKQDDGAAALIPWLGVPVSVAVLIILGGRVSWFGLLGFWALLLFGPFLAVRWLRRFPRFRSGGMRLLAVTAVLAGVVCAMVVVAAPAPPKRCVSTQTMRVVPASDCQAGQNGFPVGGPVVWYYGGAGTGIGTRVNGGSEDQGEPPGEPAGNNEDDPDDNGNTSNSGDTGGDDGGDDSGGSSAGGGGDDG